MHTTTKISGAITRAKQKFNVHIQHLKTPIWTAFENFSKKIELNDVILQSCSFNIAKRSS